MVLSLLSFLLLLVKLIFFLENNKKEMIFKESARSQCYFKVLWVLPYTCITPLDLKRKKKKPKFIWEILFICFCFFISFLRLLCCCGKNSISEPYVSTYKFWIYIYFFFVFWNRRSGKYLDLLQFWIIIGLCLWKLSS